MYPWTSTDHILYACIQTYLKGAKGKGGKELDEHLYSNAAFMLTLPGKILDISALNS